MNRITQRLILAALVVVFAVGISDRASAQASVALYCINPSGSQATNNLWVPCSASNPLQVNASVSASISGFRPVAYGTPISVTTGGNTGTLPTNTGEVVATNVGTTNGAYCALGASATTSSQYIAPNGGWFAFAISGDTQLTCITSTSTTTVNTAGGSGLPTGTGGGGGGSSGGGAVFGPTAVGSAAANPPVLIAGTANAAATGNVQVAKVSATGLVSVDGSTVTQPISAASGAAVLGSLVDINNGTNTPWPGTGTTSLLGGVFGVYNQLVALNTIAAKPSPCIAGTAPSTQTAVATGATTAAQCDLNGNLYISPQQAAGAPLGQAVAAASVPVVLPALQVTALTPIALNDPCGAQNTKLGAPISLTASGQIITGTSAKKTYICGIDVVPAAAQNIALVEGTGSVCATNIFGLAGGTTAATGWNFQLGGGIARGSGEGTVYSPSADANATAANVCLLIAGAGQVSGQISYVQQ